MKHLLRSAFFVATLGIILNPLLAKPVPENLGNGLDKLVASNVAIKTAKAQNKRINTVTFNGQQYTDQATAGMAQLALSDAQGRLLVRINLTGALKPDELVALLSTRLPGVTVTSIDPKYRNVGVMNALVSTDDVPMLAGTRGVRSVILELKPRHNRAPVEPPSITATLHKLLLPPPPNATPGQVYPNLGTFFDQGVVQHRVDQVNQYYNPSAPVDYEGSGLSIACISNSFAANTAHPASLDVTNNDLPGSGSNPVGNTTPVFVLLDDLSSNTSDDEGRGMCQIVYHMAPKARVGFGTADEGEVSFANVIRGLAGINSPDFPNASSQGFAADVICDDVGYFDEPFYEDGIIGAGVNDVAAAGVHYFSSAANDIGTNGYESEIRVVPNGSGLTAATNSALAGTNINLTGVPANLYAGGFHNFNPNGLDIAQTVNIAANNTVPTILQWNDPYDQNGGIQSVGGQIYANSGTISSTQKTATFNGSSTPPLPQFTAGQGYQVVEMATSGTLDAIITIIDPSGNTLLVQDTGVDETVNFVAPFTGQYQIIVGRYGTTTGTFNLTVNLATITSYVGSDWNLLVFSTTGAYISGSSLTTNNLASNEPIELGYTNYSSGKQVQYVLARSNTPTGPNVADHIRYLLPANGRSGYGPAKYFTYNTVTTGGHAMANGCNGTAAYSVFRPNVPEYFTSPGPVTVYFDSNQNRFDTPEVRLQPGIAAADAANISVNEGLAGLGSDSTSDYDAAANFSGTSAAAPHAAACALLVLEAHGGYRSVTPAQMMTLLHSSTFVHDLDPNYSSGSARASNGDKIAITISSDNESNTGTGLNDTNSFAVAYSGSSYITSLSFNPAGTAATGGCVTCGNNGLDTNNAYFSNVYPGLVFMPSTKAFTFGTGSVGLASGDVSAVYSNLAPAPSNGTSQYWTMTLSSASGNFTGGKILRFTVGRGVQHSSVVESTAHTPVAGSTSAQYSADLFGGGVLIPEGTVTNDGMAFSGTLGDGSTFSGTIKNRLGSGYSVLDGFGFINEQQAVVAPLQ
ncbi:MAG: hypothetical protein JO354_05475 [Verrucomicrobia bacterium]|nr:hypothetical protein [Verrucomicrobiota bacterium]